MSILNQPFRQTPSCFSFQIDPESRNDDFLKQPIQQDTLTSADQEKKKEIDALLSEAMNGLTFDERQEQQEVLHGVDDEIIEETNFVNSALKDLENHLLLIKHGTLYETAERMSPDYVNSRAFRLMFLRGNRYDVKAAADQMIKFFGAKEQLFGREKLVKDITIKDLDEDDLDSLKSGTFHWAGKDRSSRQILFQLPGLRAYKTLVNELRARYYITMHALRSEDVQLRGVSAINYAVGAFADKMNGAGFMENTKLSVYLPLYVASFHVCGSDVAQHLFGNVALRVMPAKLRARCRLHLGSHIEVQYILSTYGISPSLLPLKPWTNDVDMTGHLKWVQDRLDEVKGDISDDYGSTNHWSPSSGGAVVTKPNPNDILPTGSKKSDNVGNDRLRELVKDSVEAYRSSSYGEKRRIVDRIINEIHGAGGRFLQQEKNGSQAWSELPLSKVRIVITQKFRNHNRRRETASQQAREGALIAGTPLPNDVIFGRAQRSKGNDLLHHLIKDRSAEYEALSRGMKVSVVDDIIERIKSEGGRFLQPTADLEGYVELSTDSIRERISTYFRNNRRSLKRKNTH